MSIKLNWGLIAALSFVALIRPLMSMTGISEMIGQPFASIAATILISIAWIAAVIMKKEPQPVLTLLVVGIGYGILAMIVSGILSPILTGQLQGPLANPLAAISVLVTNAIWGLLAGTIAGMFMKYLKTAS